MSMVTWWFVPRSPEPLGEIGTPIILPVALAEAEVKLPWERCVEPGKLNVLVPLELCVNSPLARQSTDTTPVGPATVKKLGLPVVFVLNRMDVRLPLKSPFGIGPKPSRVLQTMKDGSH
jgi:hypothetical protein